MSAQALKMTHVLIVEDEQHLAIGLKYNFEAEGYQVSAVGDGPAALKLIEAAPDEYDLVILDLMLPGMSGYAVCERLREAGNEVPILMLSARTLAEDRIRGFDIGADQYLEKPFELEELLSRVRNLLQRRHKIPPPTESELHDYSFGNVRINFDTYEATVAGRRLRLTYIELKLIRYFVEHEGLVVSRSALLEDVWGISANVTTRTVDNFMMRLRKFFEENPSRPRHFLSLRGAGYQFVSQPDEDEPSTDAR